MIKVKEVKQHLPSTYSSMHKLVTEAKLVLVPGYYPTCKSMQLKGNVYYPIAISETEKIEVGDWVYNTVTHKIYTVNEGLSVVLQGNSLDAKSHVKILALPEHFSPEILQQIIDGKLKDGDKALVECEKNIKYNKVWWCEEHKPVKYQSLSNVIPVSIYQIGGSKGLKYEVIIALPTGHHKVSLDEIEIEENNEIIIKLNSSNHIQIYPVEENPNMYNLEVGKQYWFQYIGCKSDWFHGIVTHFTKFGHPWVKSTDGSNHNGIISPGLYKIQHVSLPPPVEEKMYTRDEVGKIIAKYWQDEVSETGNASYQGFSKWFEQNVK